MLLILTQGNQKGYGSALQIIQQIILKRIFSNILGSSCLSYSRWLLHLAGQSNFVDGLSHTFVSTELCQSFLFA